jgi:predicted flap endonuclease-1-like 5' DNA nuclease
MELVTRMDFIREYWLILLIVLVVAIALAAVILRPRQSVRLTDSSPVRPHMADRPPEGRGIAGEAAAAASDVAGELFRAPVHDKLEGQSGGPEDDFTRMKGVGPKFADALRGLGFHRFEQLAGLTPPEIERLDPQLGAFNGRIVRDRVVEQSDYLARNDLDGFEQRFGKL